MPRKPKIQIPDTSKNPDAGIVRNKGHAYAAFTQDGKRHRRKIGTDDSTVPALRAARNKVYRELLAAGATVAVRGTPKITRADRRERALENPMMYLRHEPRVTGSPWSVRFDDKVLGRYLTEELARAARNKKLGVK